MHSTKPDTSFPITTHVRKKTPPQKHLHQKNLNAQLSHQITPRGVKLSESKKKKKKEGEASLIVWHGVTQHVHEWSAHRCNTQSVLRPVPR